jgi:hypothetical protein
VLTKGFSSEGKDGAWAVPRFRGLGADELWKGVVWGASVISWVDPSTAGRGCVTAFRNSSVRMEQTELFLRRRGLPGATASLL